MGDKKGAVFCDRDGVIVEALVERGLPRAVASVDDLVLAAGAREGCAQLRESGFEVVVITNQPDIARGVIAREAVETMHDRLYDELDLDAIYMCPHDDVTGCECRKPKAGLLLRASSDRGLDLSKSYVIGDRWRDVGAGTEAGCRTVFVDHDYRERTPDNPDATVRTFAAAVEWILADARVVSIR